MAAKSTSVSLHFTAILRVEGAPELHDELNSRLGAPSTVLCEPSDPRRNLWALETPRPAIADINEHLAWAAALVETHEDFFQKLVSENIRVTLHLGCTTNIEYALLGFDTHLFGPFVRTGISLEFYAGLNS
jgi:hypothetical protein